MFDIASRHGLKVIEDACQAHGAEYKGHKAGSLGDAAGFSFYYSKNLGGYGEGGFITTNNADLAVRMRKIHDHGQASVITMICRSQRPFRRNPGSGFTQEASISSSLEPAASQPCSII